VAPVPGKSAPEDPVVAGLVVRTGALEAWRFAAAAHEGQLRAANLAPYIHHPERVAELTAANGGDEAMVAAALLHDVLEDSPAQPEEILERFGADVGDLVVALSDDRAISDYGERKAALREQVREAGPRAALIYACDKLANSSDLRDAYAEIGEPVAERLEITLDQRLQIWREDEALCREQLGDS
jgi:(p)ppGpp synthase/HD superfamily hydrolase